MGLSIITDDTSVKLPKFNKWKQKYAAGIDIRKDPIIKSRLSQYNFDYPVDDIENEILFKRTLCDFVRPAKQMYGGMFTEIRHFAELLSASIPTEIFFISGRYGIIPENQEIIPYYFRIEDIEDVQIVDKKFNINQKIKEIIKNSEIIIFLLPKHYIAHLIKIGFFNEELTKSSLIIVSSDEYQNYFSQFHNVLFLRRIGVARIGTKNREKILKFVVERKNTLDN
jgi:hypothetical protein